MIIIPDQLPKDHVPASSKPALAPAGTTFDLVTPLGDKWRPVCGTTTVVWWPWYSCLLSCFGFGLFTFDFWPHHKASGWELEAGMWEVAFKSFASPVYSTLAFYDNGLASANNEYKESLGTCHCNKSRLTPLGLNKCKGGANLLQTLPMKRTRGGRWPKASLWSGL